MNIKWKWPLTIVVSIALVIIGVALLGGTALQISEEVQAAVVGWVGGGVALATPVLLAILARDSDGDGTPDVVDPTPRGETRG